MDVARRELRLLAPAALLISLIATGLVVTTNGLVPNPLHIALMIIACGAYGAMLVAEPRWGGLSIRVVAISTLVTAVVAIIVVPRFTGDLWSYAMYGRMLGVHHMSPWTHAPTDVPHDPLLHLVARTWRHTPSVYGPAFTLVSGSAARVLGTSVVATRVFYQALAAMVLGAGGWLVWRETRSAPAVAFLTVHPLVIMFLVNGGRNDIMVGVAMLAAVVLVARRRVGAAGVVAALGALVKITGVVGIAALFVTMVARGERRAAYRMLRVAGVVFGVAYLVAGTAALFAPMQTAGALYSDGSAWSSLSLVGVALPGTHLALALLAVVVLVVIVRHARSRSSTAVAAALGMLSLAAAYTLPGYAAWGLPAAALDHRGRVARILAAAGVVFIVTYEIVQHPFSGVIGSALHTLATVGGPLAVLALVVLLLRTPTPRTQEHLMPVAQLPTLLQQPSAP